MNGAMHIFPAPQADYLRAMKGGRHQPCCLSGVFPPRFSLVDAMPPVYQQALQGTCVANAVTALLEYYTDMKTRLSMQYLHAATKEIERAGLERNLAALRAEGSLDPEFEAACHSELMQLRLIASSNEGGMSGTTARPYLEQFANGIRERFESASGCLLKSCFKAVETRGICRFNLWPSSGARATPLFGAAAGGGVFPPDSHEDAAKRRVTGGIYLLGMPNNVDEIRGIISGANDRRPMPVAVTVDFFAGCDGETYSFPEAEEAEDGQLVSKDEWLGRHGLLLVGYEDDPKALGGGSFIIRNSLGEKWGDKGYGRMPYAYLECFAVEAGTILQSMVDYAGDGYCEACQGAGGMARHGRAAAAKATRARLRYFFLNVLVAALLVLGTWAAATWLSGASGAGRPAKTPEPPPGPQMPPFAEITVYGRDATMEATLPPPWSEVKGVAIDGGCVFRLPVTTREEVDEIRRRLAAVPTLREKRGKPLTYDMVAFFDLAADDIGDLKKTIGMFRAENFLVRIEGESNGVLRVATISPQGLRGRLQRVYKVRDAGGRRLELAPIREERPSATNVPPPAAAQRRDPPAAKGAPPPAVVKRDPPVAATNVVQGVKEVSRGARSGASEGRGSDF